MPKSRRKVPTNKRFWLNNSLSSTKESGPMNGPLSLVELPEIRPPGPLVDQLVYPTSLVCLVLLEKTSKQTKSFNEMIRTAFRTLRISYMRASR